MDVRGELELIEVLRSGTPPARVRAAGELARVGGPAAVSALREVLGSRDPLLRLTAGFALWRIVRDRQGLEAVVEALTGASPDAREGAVYALGAMGKEVVPFLEDLLMIHPDRPEIRRILEEIRGQLSHQN